MKWQAIPELMEGKGKVNIQERKKCHQSQGDWAEKSKIKIQIRFSNPNDDMEDDIEDVNDNVVMEVAKKNCGTSQGEKTEKHTKENEDENAWWRDRKRAT